MCHGLRSGSRGSFDCPSFAMLLLDVSYAERGKVWSEVLDAGLSPYDHALL